MKKLFLLIAITLHLPFAMAEKPSCFQQAVETLKEPVEKNLFRNHPLLHSFIECDRPGYGMEVVIHEAAHFEDLGIPHKATEEDLERWWKENKFFEFKLHDLHGNKHAEMQIKDAPKPQKLILEFLNKHHPEVMESDSHTINSFIESYLNDETTYASYLFTKGLVSELNAYTHGLRFEYRNRSGEDTMLGQRYGVLIFLIFFKAYIHEASLDSILWKDLERSENKAQLEILFQQAGDLLTTTLHCKTMDQFERGDLFSLLSDEATLSPLRKLITKSSLNKILCL